MQHFQSILIVIGLIAIGGVLIHGYLLSRKENNNSSQSASNVDIFAEKPVSEETDGVISEVRIISNEAQKTEEAIDFSQALNDENITVAEFTEKVIEPTANVAESEPTVITLDNQSLENQDNESQDLDNNNFESNEQIAPLEEVEDNNSEPVEEPLIDNDVFLAEEEQPQDLFIFNVVARDGEKLGGHELLQFFLTSGFRFGEMSIFHRHENSDGTGPVLFSIANMMAPGVFEPENMEQFQSEGVSFFLTAPNKHIDIKASFEMMLRAVEQIAEEFNCDVLNAQREPMTKEQFIEYNHRLLHYI